MLETTEIIGLVLYGLAGGVLFFVLCVLAVMWKDM